MATITPSSSSTRSSGASMPRATSSKNSSLVQRKAAGAGCAIAVRVAPRDPDGNAYFRLSRSDSCSVAVVLRLVRPLGRDADVRRLLRRELRQLDAELLEVQARHLLVELLGEHVDRLPVLGGVPPQLELRQHLI